MASEHVNPPADDMPTRAPMEDIQATVPPADEEAVFATRLPEEESLPARPPSTDEPHLPFLPPLAPELEGVQVPGYEILGEFGRGGIGLRYPWRL